ncbi:MAG: hypothetical protein WD991_01820 [Candidatus Paceibacterota bacterium]
MSSVTPIRPAGVEVPGGTILGKATKGVIPHQDGKIILGTLEELFKTLEVSKGAWAGRTLPTPDTPIEVLPIQGTCTIEQAVDSLGIDRERLAFRRSQVAGFAENCDSLIPMGGYAGAWMLYWEGSELSWAYIFRASGSDAGLVTMGSDFDEALPGHQGHALIVPEKR